MHPDRLDVVVVRLAQRRNRAGGANTLLQLVPAVVADEVHEEGLEGGNKPAELVHMDPHRVQLVRDAHVGALARRQPARV
eukprot:3057771-Prymnesium_polylepis.1